MSDKITITRDGLIKAFKLWNEDFFDSPDRYGELNDSVDCATWQADHLLLMMLRVSSEGTQNETE